jgi:outer membrane protein assembly factor BamE (lipoprotein component of BamABCDE complex)
MNTPIRSITSRLGLAAVLALGAAGTALADDVSPDAISQISVGESQDAVQRQFGEPIKVSSYLFAPGKAWFYYVKGGVLGNERVIQVNFDSNGVVESTRVVDADVYELDRFD